jgi:histone-lysine N-methyltransferase SETDB1
MVQDGKNYGDEFLADLDCMEVAERTKEGYESNVPSDSDSNGSDETSDSAMDAGQEDDSQDSDYAITFKKKKRCVRHLLY